MIDQVQSGSNGTTHLCIGLDNVGEQLFGWSTHQTLKSLPVKRRELRLDLRVVDQDEMPAFSDVGRVNGSVEDASLYIVGNGIRFKTPHRAGRVNCLVNIHDNF